MILAVLAVVPALGRSAGVVGVAAQVPYLGVGSDNALLQCSDSGDHLKGGAGGVGACKCPVDQGSEGICRIFLPVTGVVGQVEGRIGGGSQYIKAVYI